MPGFLPCEEDRSYYASIKSPQILHSDVAGVVQDSYKDQILNKFLGNRKNQDQHCTNEALAAQCPDADCQEGDVQTITPVGGC